MSADGAARVFVTGCRGQLGRDVMDVFAPGLTVAGADLPELDITSAESVAGGLAGRHLDALVNCAAYTQVDRCEQYRDAARAVNVDGPLLLAKYAAAHDTFLVHVSTDYVFDGTRQPPQPYAETDRPAPRSVYGLTKYEGELAIRAVAPRAAIVRTAWLYGRHGHNFLKTMLRLALTDPDRCIRVVDDQHGCPTWSRTLAGQLKVIVQQRTTGVLHATGGDHCTWYTFARTFLELMDVAHRLEPCATADYPTPAPRPSNSILENAVLKRAGLHVMRPWHEDLTDFVGRYRDALVAEARAALS